MYYLYFDEIGYLDEDFKTKEQAELVNRELGGEGHVLDEQQFQSFNRRLAEWQENQQQVQAQSIEDLQYQENARYNQEMRRKHVMFTPRREYPLFKPGKSQSTLFSTVSAQVQYS